LRSLWYLKNFSFNCFISEVSERILFNISTFWKWKLDMSIYLLLICIVVPFIRAIKWGLNVEHVRSLQENRVFARSYFPPFCQKHLFLIIYINFSVLFTFCFFGWGTVKGSNRRDQTMASLPPCAHKLDPSDIVARTILTCRLWTYLSEDSPWSKKHEELINYVVHWALCKYL
jgi:hypothetical protein